MQDDKIPKDKQCEHPFNQRWQLDNDMWQCCVCYGYFWGSKRVNPGIDIYGRKE